MKFSVNFWLKQFHHIRSFSVVQFFCRGSLFCQRMATLAKIIQISVNINMKIIVIIWLIQELCQFCRTKLPYFDQKQHFQLKIVSFSENSLTPENFVSVNFHLLRIDIFTFSVSTNFLFRSHTTPGRGVAKNVTICFYQRGRSSTLIYMPSFGDQMGDCETFS